MAITNGYATVAEVAEVLGIDDTDDDVRIEAAINSASRDIDAWCGRRFWQDAVVATRVYYPIDRMEAPVDDISTDTGLVVKIDDDADGVYETTLTQGTDFLLLPVNADVESPAQPWTSIRMLDTYYLPRDRYRPTLQVTAKFGWPAVPDQVAQACRIQAKLIYKSTGGTYAGFQLASDVGIVMRTPSLDPVAAGLLAPYRLEWVA